jgi:hypothetical protein
MNPGAGEELKHLMAGVKSKTSKPEGIDINDKALDIKPNGDETKSSDKKNKGLDPKVKGLNLNALGDAVKGANSNRRSIAIWSPKISAVMWYLKKTTPEFSISEEARAILEEGLEKKYPELFKRVKEELGRP